MRPPPPRRFRPVVNLFRERAGQSDAMVVAAWLVGVVPPLLFNPFGRGIGARLLGIVVSFNIALVASFGSLVLIYSLFASTRLRRGLLWFSAFAASSWIAGQALGYVVTIRAISGFANAFGRYAPAGEVAAVAFLIYLQHLIFVFGYLLALVLNEEQGEQGVRPRGTAAASETVRAPRHHRNIWYDAANGLPTRRDEGAW